MGVTPQQWRVPSVYRLPVGIIIGFALNLIREIPPIREGVNRDGSARTPQTSRVGNRGTTTDGGAILALPDGRQPKPRDRISASNSDWARQRTCRNRAGRHGDLDSRFRLFANNHSVSTGRVSRVLAEGAADTPI